MFMDEFRDIDFKGIGEGLSIFCRRDLSPSESTISLNDDWQAIYQPQGSQREGYSNTSMIKSNFDAEPRTKSNECPSATIHDARPVSSSNERHLQLTLTPLERYCYYAQAYEQLAIGQITDRRSLARLSELDETLDATAILVTGFTSQSSAPSSSVPSPTLGGDPEELGGLLMAESPDIQAASREEDSKYLHKIAKLRRRLKAEGGPRAMKSVRVRKRSQASKMSNETSDGAI